MTDIFLTPLFHINTELYIKNKIAEKIFSSQLSCMHQQQSPLWFVKKLERCVRLLSLGSSRLQDLGSGEGAAVPQLARCDVLGDLSKLGGDRVLKERRGDVNILRIFKQ